MAARGYLTSVHNLVVQHGKGYAIVRRDHMDLRGEEDALLDAYLTPFTDLAGDRRTARLLDATVRGIIGSESLCCSRIAAFSPCARRHAPRRATDPAHGAW